MVIALKLLYNKGFKNKMNDTNNQLIEWLQLTNKLFANNSNVDINNQLINLLNKEHRTIQQLLFKNLIMTILKHYSNCDRFDDRNKATIEFCKSINQSINNAQFPYI
jgi:archaellin